MSNFNSINNIYTPQSRALYIHNKRWYFHLVSKDQEYKRGRALMDDYRLSDIVGHLVICYTPKRLPHQYTLFVNKKGNTGRIYAYFSSYIEFFHYLKYFQNIDKNFYEIIFGEFAQKPHFDIDIDQNVCQSLYPNLDYITIGQQLKDSVITACREIIPTLNIEKDVLLYSSHGATKQSYHIVINNYYHDTNIEAKAFYEEVCLKIPAYKEFIDHSVYSPRQQFRVLGSQKTSSQRPKLFNQEFEYLDTIYTHQYIENVENVDFWTLTMLAESLVSFTSNCKYIPSLVKEKLYEYNYSSLDLSEDIIHQCLEMLKNKMEEEGYRCPFSFLEAEGSLILLRREAPSTCPICKRNEPHEHENSYMFIYDSKLYWDCRRSEGKPKFFVGYINIPIKETEEAEESLPMIPQKSALEKLHDLQLECFKQKQEQRAVAEYKKLVYLDEWTQPNIKL